MGHVFLSYARSDVGRAKALAAAIERAGFAVWWDRELLGGAEYSREIDEALKAAGAIVVLWSKDSVDSAWVRDEAAAGRDTQRLIPVSLDRSEPPLGFRQFQTIDLSRWNGRADNPAIKTLRRAIEGRLGRGAPTVLGSTAPPAGRRAVPRWSVLAALGALVAAAGGYLLLSQARTEVIDIAIATVPGAADSARSEALARALAVDVGRLRIASEENAFDLTESSGSATAADYVVRVAAARSGGGASAELSLVAGDNPQILWTGRYERTDGDSAALRQQVATRLAALLACVAEAKPASGVRLDDATMKLYLRGCERADEPVGAKAEPELISMFRQVTEREPRFAPAWAHLALLEFRSETIGQTRVDSPSQKRGRDYFEKARKLDPDLPILTLLEASRYPYSEWEKRLAIFEKGLSSHPDSAELHDAISIDLRQVGRMNDALDSARRAAELNPLSPRMFVTAIPLLSATGRLDEARDRLRTAERLWPGVPVVTDARYAFDLRYGDAANALAILQREPGRASSIIASTSVPNPAVALFLKARLEPTQANKAAAIAAFVARGRKDPKSIDVASLVDLGAIDLAFRMLEHPVTLESAANFTGVFFRAPLKPFRDDPRFMPLAARLGLVRYWLSTGKWPDFCLEADLPYDCQAEAKRLSR